MANRFNRERWREAYARRAGSKRGALMGESRFLGVVSRLAGQPLNLHGDMGLQKRRILAGDQAWGPRGFDVGVAKNPDFFLFADDCCRYDNNGAKLRRGLE